MTTRKEHLHCRQCDAPVGETDDVLLVSEHSPTCMDCADAVVDQRAADRQEQFRALYASQGLEAPALNYNDIPEGARCENPSMAQGHICPGCDRRLHIPADLFWVRNKGLAPGGCCTLYCYWRSKHGGYKPPMVCENPGCGEVFEVQRGTRKYCSTRCRVAAHRKPKTDKPPAQNPELDLGVG